MLAPGKNPIKFALRKDFKEKFAGSDAGPF